MVKSMYVRETGYPIPEKQFALTLRVYDGVEVDTFDLSFFGYDMATTVVATDQVTWKTCFPTMITCEFCGNCVTRPCLTLDDMKQRAVRFTKSACVTELEKANKLTPPLETAEE